METDSQGKATATGEPHRLTYDLVNNNTDRSGVESLPTISLQVSSFKEKKFLRSDINQLESCLSQTQVLKQRPWAPIRWSDQNKGQNKQMWDPGMPASWPVPEGSPIPTLQRALSSTSSLPGTSVQTMRPNLLSLMIWPGFPAHC